VLQFALGNGIVGPQAGWPTHDGKQEQQRWGSFVRMGTMSVAKRDGTDSIERRGNEKSRRQSPQCRRPGCPLLLPKAEDTPT
jgi:hypothetical protein